MEIVAAIGSIGLIFVVLWDGFINIVVPNPSNMRIQFSSLFYRFTWIPWMAVARRIPVAAGRDLILSIYGPLSSILLLSIWAGALITGFAGLQWAMGSQLTTPGGTPAFGTDLYFSGVTFFTLGYGDVTPHTVLGRVAAVVEAGVGFGFLAIIIGYLPVLYQTYAKRETLIAMLDARAGSPPTACGLFSRHKRWADTSSTIQFFEDWEEWVADVLETHTSHPVLSLYRSHHAGQSWVSALTVVLDACALVMVGMDGVPVYSAYVTFALAQHAVVDLCEGIQATPTPPKTNRLPKEDVAKLRARLTAEGIKLRDGADADMELTQLRRMYEPYVNGLAQALLLTLPPWLPTEETNDELWRRRLFHPDAVHEH